MKRLTVALLLLGAASARADDDPLAAAVAAMTRVGAAGSPSFSPDRIVAPTLVLHGANDTNVPVVEAEQAVARLKKRNVPVELVLFSDEGHGFRKIGNRIKANVAVVRWFVKYLK